jgi:ECF sigma factor
VDLLALDDALNELAKMSVLGVSSATVERDWAVARAWLHREISRTACDES